MILRVTTGETMRWTGTWRAAGVPVNLTGYSLTAEVFRWAYGENVTSTSVTLADQGTSPGVFTLDVSGLSAGRYRLRIRFVEPDSDVRRSSYVELIVEDP